MFCGVRSRWATPTAATQYTHRQPTTATQYTHRQPTSATQYTHGQPTSATQYTHRTPAPPVTASTTDACGRKEETLQRQDHEIETGERRTRAHTGDRINQEAIEEDTSARAGRSNKPVKQNTKAKQAL